MVELENCKPRASNRSVDLHPEGRWFDPSTAHVLLKSQFSPVHLPALCYSEQAPVPACRPERALMGAQSHLSDRFQCRVGCLGDADGRRHRGVNLAVIGEAATGREGEGIALSRRDHAGIEDPSTGRGRMVVSTAVLEGHPRPGWNAEAGWAEREGVRPYGLDDGWRRRRRWG